MCHGMSLGGGGAGAEATIAHSAFRFLADATWSLCVARGQVCKMAPTAVADSIDKLQASVTAALASLPDAVVGAVFGFAVAQLGICGDVAEEEARLRPPPLVKVRSCLRDCCAAPMTVSRIFGDAAVHAPPRGCQPLMQGTHE